MSMLDDIAEYLEDQNIGTVAVDIFCDYMPETPDAVIAIFDYPSVPPQHTMGDSGPVLQHHRLQVLVRGAEGGTGTVAARDQARAIYDLLVTQVGTTINNKLYVDIAAVEEPHLLDRDSSQRATYAVNFDVTKEP